MKTVMTTFALGALALSALACGGNDGTTMMMQQTQDPNLIPGFSVPPLQAGYTRYITPVVKNIQPGQDITYCQWLVAPSDRDLTIAAFTSGQSKFGHHVVLYSNTMTSPVGTSRECTSADMLSVRFVGGSAGEGNSLDFKLPPNVVYRVPKGTALMANVHFINTSREAIDGQAFIDVDLVDARADEQVAGMFTNVNGSFVVPANSMGTADMNCTVMQDMSFFAFTNHMHEWGFSAYSEVIRQGAGQKEMLMEDHTWAPERVFNPRFAQWNTDALMQIRAGDTIHTHCEWDNTTADELTFPTEMCVGIAFYLPGGEEINCVDGSWGQ